MKRNTQSYKILISYLQILSGYVRFYQHILGNACKLSAQFLFPCSLLCFLLCAPHVASRLPLHSFAGSQLHFVLHYHLFPPKIKLWFHKNNPYIQNMKNYYLMNKLTKRRGSKRVLNTFPIA